MRLDVDVLGTLADDDRLRRLRLWHFVHLLHVYVGGLSTVRWRVRCVHVIFVSLLRNRRRQNAYRLTIKTPMMPAAINSNAMIGKIIASNSHSGAEVACEVIIEYEVEHAILKRERMVA
jgi:hypothetical protein